MATSTQFPPDYNRSGLVRDISTWGAFVLGISCICLASAIPYSWIPSSWPGADIVTLLAISMAVSCVHAYAFAAIGTAYSKSASDYVLTTRSSRTMFGKSVAFASSWSLGIASALAAGALIAWIPRTVLPSLLQPLAILSKDYPTLSQFYEQAALFSATPFGTLLIGTAFLTIAYCLIRLPNRLVITIMSMGLILSFVAWAIIYYSLSRASQPETFVNAWNEYVGSTSPYGAFDKRLALAREAGMPDPSPSAHQLWAGLIMGFWIFYGYAIPTYFAGEVKRSRSGTTLLIASISSILISGLIFLGAAYLLQQIVPREWLAAEGFLNSNQGEVEKLANTQVPTYPWITFYAAILYPNVFWVHVTAIAWMIALVNLVQTYFYYCSRLGFAWSFDGIIPKSVRLDYVNPRTSCPTISMTYVALLAEIGLVQTAYLGLLDMQLTFVFIALATQLVSIWALIRLPMRHRVEFDIFPPFVRARLFGIPVVSIVGCVTLVYLVGMLFAFFYVPALGGPDPVLPLVTLVLLFGLGLGVFWLRSFYFRRQHIDFGAVFGSPPPD